jgi:hypothetical protein
MTSIFGGDSENAYFGSDAQKNPRSLSFPAVVPVTRTASSMRCGGSTPRRDNCTRHRSTFLKEPRTRQSDIRQFLLTVDHARSVKKEFTTIYHDFHSYHGSHVSRISTVYHNLRIVRPTAALVPWNVSRHTIGRYMHQDN